MMIRRTGAIFLVLTCFAATAFADDLADVEKLMKAKVGGVISVLRDKQLDEKVRRDDIIEIVGSVFDFNLMARLSLGKKYWPGLSQPQQKKFTDLFVKRIQDSYLDKMDLYSDETVKYESPRMVESRIHLQTHLVSSDNTISVLYKLYKSKAGWKIYDLEIQGVSFIQTFRAQFEGVLKTGTIDDLIKKMESPSQFTLETPDHEKDGSK